MMMSYLLAVALWTITKQQALSPSINITNTILLYQEADAIVMSDGVLNHIYDDTTYNQVLNCKNGQLYIINKTHGTSIVFSYRGLGLLTNQNTHVYIQPNQEPVPYLDSFTASSFTMQFNCPQIIDSHNYFNKINIELLQKYNISFMIDCDPGHRHKTFQYGYLILAAINALILITVAMNSYVWSIKYNGKLINIQLKWSLILVICLVGVALAAALYLFAFKDFMAAFVTLRYVGIGASSFFVFICFNEVLYLVKVLIEPVFKLFGVEVRRCELLSFSCTLGITILALFVQNWILYNIMASCICVASIKLFQFSSLKQAFLSMGVAVLTVTIVAVILHYILPDRSYNDYATELSSPLFLMVPDLDQGLYKKCSWLLVVDVIVPGVMLAYLRLYDQNKGSKWGGVYTVWGNVTVILATILWVGLQAIYPFSVPFSLVVYLLLMLVIFTLSWKRNQWPDLYKGVFWKDRSVIDESKLSEKNRNFSALVDDDIMESLKKARESQDELSRSGKSSSIYSK